MKGEEEPSFQLEVEYVLICNEKITDNRRQRSEERIRSIPLTFNAGGVTHIRVCLSCFFD